MDVKVDRRLQAHIEGLVKGFQGEVGIYVKDLRRGTIASIRADELFPTASIVKVPILIGIMDNAWNPTKNPATKFEHDEKN